MRALDWRRWLVYTHRWLGIAGCVLFVAWFISGVVMMYARMPTLAPEERLARAPALDLSSMMLTPAAAAQIAGVTGNSVQVSMLRDRPVYRFGGGRDPRIVFADTGELFEGIGVDEAREVARRFEPDYPGTLHDDGYVTTPDQWTLQARALMPMHRFALDDAADTRLYVSEVTGDVVLRTTGRERFWAYLGPVIHWVYFTPLRQNGPLWSEVIIWSSTIGCVMCASGLVWGLMRFSPSARFRLKRRHARSPYAGMMKWHHYAGLFFGLVTLTWTYSGLLSMGPFGWFEPVARGSQARASREPQGLEQVSLERLHAAHAAISQAFAPRSFEMRVVQGEMFWATERPPALADADRWRSPSLLPRAARPSLERRYVSATNPEQGTFTNFPREAMVEIARTTMPGVSIEDSVWLDAYDGYYYDPSGTLPLPVLRVRYTDPQSTWLYLDPSRGGVVDRLESATRQRRWLYHGLHNLDFPFLYYRRPLWDVVVIVLSIGGAVLSATTITPALRRLSRHLRRWRQSRSSSFSQAGLRPTAVSRSESALGAARDRRSPRYTRHRRAERPTP